MKRDPSVPDRERIDSDVRAFMRPVSTPWITFDRDSRVEGELAFATKAAMRAGVAFMSSPDLPPHAPGAVNVPAVQITPRPTAASRLADINAMFPASVPAQKASTNTDEPSSLIVAADVVPTERQPSLGDFVPVRKNRVGLIGATLGAVGVCSIAAYVVASLQAAPTPAAAAEPTKAVETVAAVAPPPPPEPAVEAPTPPPAPEVAPAEVVGEKATDPAKRWGTLTIKGDATKKQVWFDGKRMLGSGKQSFMVYCGMHTVAVTDKAAQKDMEVPCNGELAIEK